LISDIKKYFTHGPEVVLLPALQWNYEDMPDFDADGFYLDYGHILTAHPPLRDRMFYGLKRLAFIINDGVINDDSYFLNCYNFEQTLEQMYQETTEDIINIEDLEYESLLTKAAANLTYFVSEFSNEKIDLSENFKSAVCPQASRGLYKCLKEDAEREVQSFYRECLDYITKIFPKGEETLKALLDDDLFYPLVEEPVENWFEECKDLLGTDSENMYTDEFQSEFESSMYFDKCQIFVAGKISWHEWTECSKSCGGGLRFKVAEDCVPSYAHCLELPVKQEVCNSEPCLYGANTDSPPGTIVAWIPKPNSNADFDAPIPDKWILCDGKQKCRSGHYQNETCTDLSNKGLIGTASSSEVMAMKAASFPDHFHNHKHTGVGTYTHSNHHANGHSHCGMGGTRCSERTDQPGDDRKGSITVDFSVMKEDAAKVSAMRGPDIQLKDNELFPPHLRVYYLFKCV